MPLRSASARVFLRCSMAALAAVPILSSVEAVSMNQGSSNAPFAPHRDGNVAIAEELAAARRAGTAEAYDLFLARHPAHSLARAARRERALLASSRPRRTDISD
jgi:hypothetical protein